MKLTSNAGPFTLEAWTDGYPIWVTLTDERGNRIRFAADELTDLSHAARTLEDRVKAASKC